MEKQIVNKSIGSTITRIKMMIMAVMMVIIIIIIIIINVIIIIGIIMIITMMILHCLGTEMQALDWILL